MLKLSNIFIIWQFLLDYDLDFYIKNLKIKNKIKNMNHFIKNNEKKITDVKGSLVNRDHTMVENKPVVKNENALKLNKNNSLTKKVIWSNWQRGALFVIFLAIKIR